MYHMLNCINSFQDARISSMGPKFSDEIMATSKWARWRLKSSASPLFTQLFGQAQIKENIKAPRSWSLCGEFTGERWIPRTKGQ